MKKVVALNDQSLLDLCIQEYGNLKPLFDLAQANNISIVDDLEIGKEYILPISTLSSIEIVSFYKSKTIKPATTSPVHQYSAIGIGEMIIEDTFIVS